MMMMMGIWMILPLLFIGAIVYLAVQLLQRSQNSSTQIGQTPLEILDARYGRGEISREEYEQMRLDLQG